MTSEVEKVVEALATAGKKPTLPEIQSIQSQIALLLAIPSIETSTGVLNIILALVIFFGLQLYLGDKIQSLGPKAAEKIQNAGSRIASVIGGVGAATYLGVIYHDEAEIIRKNIQEVVNNPLFDKIEINHLVRGGCTYLGLQWLPLLKKLSRDKKLLVRLTSTFLVSQAIHFNFTAPQLKVTDREGDPLLDLGTTEPHPGVYVYDADKGYAPILPPEEQAEQDQEQMTELTEATTELVRQVHNMITLQTKQTYEITNTQNDEVVFEITLDPNYRDLTPSREYRGYRDKTLHTIDFIITFPDQEPPITIQGTQRYEQGKQEGIYKIENLSITPKNTPLPDITALILTAKEAHDQSSINRIQKRRGVTQEYKINEVTTKEQRL